MARIDESTARIAWEGIHMSGYEEGSATREYEAMCDDARKAARAAEKRAPHRAEEIARILDRYEGRAADYINERNRIDAMCQSVLITGAGNFPTRKKARQNARMDAFYKKDWGFDKMLRKLRTIGTEREAIKSGDADALDRLREKLEKLTTRQERMKAANAHYRKHKSMEGFEPAEWRDAANKNLEFERDNLWFPDDDAREAHMLKTAPFASYQLSNNNAEIRRVKRRIADLEAAKEAASDATSRRATICGEECDVIENADNMRLQLVFDGKPDAETRRTLKGAGFRWAPSQGAWQRQLTDNARYALKRIATFDDDATAITA